MNFIYKENNNGGFELYNTQIGDIYFSNIGAYNEAIEKFVIPSLPIVENKSEIKILDVCFGLGYNSKTLYDYTLKNNMKIKFEIDAIEIDKNILALSLFLFDENISFDTHISFGHQMMNSINLEQNIQKILGENWIKYIFKKNKHIFNELSKENGVELHKNNKILTCLHNIYYQNQVKFKNPPKLNLFCTDLHEILPNITTKYDLIFHDAFSILKQKDMWEEDIMNYYYNILNKNGRLLTYSNSRVLRRTLEKVGFCVNINFNSANKQNGTIAQKI